MNHTSHKIMKEKTKGPQSILSLMRNISKFSFSPRLVFDISIYYIILLTLLSILYTTKFIIYFPLPLHTKWNFFDPIFDHPSSQNLISWDFITQNQSQIPQIPKPQETKTQLHHIVFGIGSSAKLWEKRKEYIKLWWRPNVTRGFTWLDKPINTSKNDEDCLLPPMKISSSISRFKYRNKNGDPSAIRISRIVSETVRLGLEDVRWIVLGDDDTFFVSDNLVRVLSKYDHNEFYYIGSSSETHYQNIRFSYNMAYGGGGFAISYRLAQALEKMQDKCIKKYPRLYGSDDRIQACMAELGVPITKEVGFHQLDIYGNAFGLLAAHPIAPLVSLHHLDLIEPIFPNVGQIQALQRLKMPIKLDSAGILQQSMCYDLGRNWSISISWGYVAQMYMGLIPAREMEIPTRTFVNWYRREDSSGFSFNTRPVDRNVCQRPFLYVLSNAIHNPSTNRTVSEYLKLSDDPEVKCKWKHSADPYGIRRVEVYKKPNSNLWDEPPRRNCCRMLPTEKKGSIAIDVGECRDGESIGF